jgi:bifunctional DNase/RNase
MGLTTSPARSILLIAGAGLCSSILIACLSSHANRPAPDEVRVKVTDVGFDQSSNTHFVMLEDQAGHRAMPIMIGDDEARSIMLELNGIKPDRPMTTDLLRNVIRQTGNQVDRVVIGNMRDEVFYAQIYLDHDRYIVDSRPSDAIALAMGAQAPIFVSGAIFMASAQAVQAAPPQFASRDGITVQDLNPALAIYFGVVPASGVLVADLAPSATNALQRGDIITQVDGRSVPNPASFQRESVTRPGSPLKLAVLRNGHVLAVTLSPSEAQLPSASPINR